MTRSIFGSQLGVRRVLYRLRRYGQEPRRRWLGLLPALLALAACSPSVPVVRVAPAWTPPAALASSGAIVELSPLPSATAERAATAPAAPTSIVPLSSPRPTPEPATPTPVVPQPTPTLTAFDSAERGDLFERVWSTVDSHYLYADIGGVDWDAIKDEYRQRALDADTPELFYATLTEMVGRLGDHHSRYEDPQQAFSQRALASGDEAYVGVGVLTVPVDDGLLVTTVFDNSPAAEAGIARRDVIVAVDGAPASHTDGRLDGPAGSRVTLTLRTPGAGERTTTLSRRAVLAQQVPEAYVLPDTNVGYVLIQSLWPQDTAERTTAALERLLSQRQELDGLIVDMRSNGGGWRTVLEGLLALFVAGEVGTFFGQSDSYPLAIEASPLRARLEGLPVVVLVDAETESYAEVFAAVLQANGRAEVVGAPSAGNTETIFAYDFEDGSRLWVAQEGFRLTDGANLEGRGVAPDRALLVDWASFAEKDDPHIIAALEMLATTAGAQ